MSNDCSCTFSNKGYLNYSYSVSGVKRNDGLSQSDTVTTCIKTDCSCLLKNQAYLNYSYTVNGVKRNDGLAESNTVTTCITSNTPTISTIKYATIKNTIPEDNFDYIIVITNTGNTPLNNLKLTDPLDSNTEYILGSAKVFINTSYASITDNSTVGNVEVIVKEPIPLGYTVIFTFKVKVKDNTTFNDDIRNKGLLTSNEITTPVETNETVVYVQYANLTITKSMDKCKVKCDEGITYKFIIENTGNVDATNVEFKDYFEDEFEFDKNNITAPKGSIVNIISEFNGINITIPNIGKKSKVEIIIPGVIKCCKDI